MQNFGTLQQFLNLPPLSPQICHSAGGRGGPRFFFIGILIFLLVRSLCKNLKPYDNPFWDFSNGGKSGNGWKKIPKIVVYLSLLRWSHALRSDQKTYLSFPDTFGQNISPRLVIILLKCKCLLVSETFNVLTQSYLAC